MHDLFSRVAEKYKTTKELWSLTLLVVLGIFFYIMNPAFLSALNISNFFAYFPELGIMALSMTFLLIAGEFDLSIGALFAFAPVIMFALRNNAGIPIELACLISIVLSAVFGFLNGILVTKVRISSFLATLGMMLIVRGVALFVANSFPQSQWSTDSWLKEVLAGSWRSGDYSIYASFIWFLVLFFVMLYVLRKTRFGNWMYATGGNIRSARERGINTDRIKIILFTLSGVFAALSGTIDAFRITSAYPIAGTGYELETIAMVVIGGTALSGGSGTLVGTLVGSILLRAMRNGIIVLGVPGLAYNIFVGAIILVMLAIYSILGRGER
ncbi:MAG TPA: ABC transporter permease [Spirochaetia bacterium]|nr:ABC transporter permease [Spirochaetia bacterium]